VLQARDELERTVRIRRSFSGDRAEAGAMRATTRDRRIRHADHD
jgi:hypothetical protein